MWTVSEPERTDPGVLVFNDGALAVLQGPGPGVTLNQDKLVELHEWYVASGRTTRADTAYMRQVQPDYDPTLPRF